MGYGSTIINKKKKLACGCFDFNFSKNRCKTHATIEDTNKRFAKHEEKENSASESVDRSNLMAELDFVFSRIIRQKYSDLDGMAICYTSGKKQHWSAMQCSHFCGRTNLATRWLESNCRVQTKYENETLDGNKKVFAANLEREQLGITDWLNEQSKQVYKPTNEELKQLLVELRHRLKIIESKFKK